MGRTLWLIGMMGVGKSSVAPLVAKSLSRGWVDSDHLVEQQTGRPVADLMADSEEAFRLAEATAIRSLAGRDVVVATGGGAVLSDAAAVMRSAGLVVWLRAGLATLSERVGHGEGRPLLTHEPRDSLSRIEAQRRDRYRAVAHEVVDTDGRDPDEVAQAVFEVWTTNERSPQ